MKDKDDNEKYTGSFQVQTIQTVAAERTQPPKRAHGVGQRWPRQVAARRWQPARSRPRGATGKTAAHGTAAGTALLPGRGALMKDAIGGLAAPRVPGMPLDLCHTRAVHGHAGHRRRRAGAAGPVAPACSRPDGRAPLTAPAAIQVTWHARQRGHTYNANIGRMKLLTPHGCVQE